MDFFLNMGLAGSLMWIFYLLVKLIGKNRLSPCWSYIMLKCVLIYYLIPIPYIKWIYRYLWKHFFRGSSLVSYAFYANEHGLLFASDQIYLTPSLKQQLVIGSLLAGTAAVIFFHNVQSYLKHRKILLRCQNDRTLNLCHEKDCRSMQKTVGIRRNIIYIDSSLTDKEGNTALTLGIWKPIILYPAKRSRHEANLILEHELYHVKNMDILWKILLDIARILHFYNPFIWFFASEFETVSEMACDTKVIRNKNEQERREYTELLIQMAQDNAGSAKWIAQISRKKEKISRRVEHIIGKNKRYYKRVFSIMLIGTTVFLNTFTAFAYNDVKVLNFGSAKIEDSEIFFQTDRAFAEEGADTAGISILSDPILYMKILYDSQFIDDTENIYDVTDNSVSTIGMCMHHYIGGTYIHHIRNSDSKCTLAFYSAQRCNMCGHIVISQKEKTAVFNICRH